MSASRFLLIWVLGALAVAGCAGRWEGARTVVDAGGRSVCALHRGPLVTERAYVYDGCYLEVEAYARIRARYPNPWQAGFSPTRVRGLPMKRATLDYCRACTDAYHAECRRRGM